MKLGISIRNFGWFGSRGDTLDELLVAEKAEELGFESVWAHDHLVMPASASTKYAISHYSFRNDLDDPLTMLAAMAVRTRRVAIGTCILCIPFRNPLLLAKMLATIDQLSRGRLILGIGTGWIQDELDAIGIGDLWPVRWTATDEWLRICMEMWSSEGPSNFEGRFHSFKGVGAFPKPVQQPRIPIWVGGYGSSAAARRAITYADGWFNTPAPPPETLAQQLADLKLRAEEYGRDFSELKIGTWSMIRRGELYPNDIGVSVHGSTDQIIERLIQYRDVGVDLLVTAPISAPPELENPQDMIESMHYLAEEIVPHIG